MVLDRAADFARTHLLAIAFCGYACGVLAIHYRFPMVAIASVAFASFIGLEIAALSPKPVKTAIFTALAAAVVGSSAALGAIWVRERAALDPLDGRHVTATIETLERAYPGASGLHARVRVLDAHGPKPFARLRGRVALLEMPADVADWDAGAIAVARVRIDVPSGPRNEGEASESDQLADQGVSVILTAHRGRDVVIAGLASGWEAWWARARSRFAGAVETRLPPLPATVLEGVLWGDRGNLPAALRQEFADTGTVHVLTTAGLHLGIMAALVSALLAQTGLPRGARATIVVACAWAYAALAGLHIPTLRAATMLTVGVIAFESGRARTASAVIAAAALAVVLPHPLALLSPSFSMSFACVSGIALLSPALAALGIQGEAAWGQRWIAELVRTGLSVQLALAPLQALYFNTFTPYAVAANLTVVPLVGFVMATGTSYAAAALLFPGIALPLSNLTWWCLRIMTGAVERFAALPEAHIDVPPPSHAFIILYWCGLVGFAWAAHARLAPLRLAAGVAAACVVLAVVYCIPGIAALADSRLHVDAIDVGQADCLLVRAPGMHAMLVDGGGKLERAGGSVVAQPIGDRIAARTVLPFLLRHWVLHIDAVVLTHPHGDHAGGLPVILSRERVGVLYDSAQLYEGPAYQRTLNVARDRHIAWRRAMRGDSFDLGPTTHVSVLAPELPILTGTSSDINNNSVVLRVEFGRTAVLLTGDAQAEAETRLLSHGGTDLHADVLKVGHHGSAYSSTPEFLAAVQPRIAIISCGRHNVFGHPSPRTLTALRDRAAAIFRTDLHGGVALVVDPAQIQVRQGDEMLRLPRH